VDDSDGKCFAAGNRVTIYPNLRKSELKLLEPQL
jgi:hypothetical protein